jgi:hypothetical protein
LIKYHETSREGDISLLLDAGVNTDLPEVFIALESIIN